MLPNWHPFKTLLLSPPRQQLPDLFADFALITMPVQTIYTAQALSASNGQAGAMAALDIIRRYRLSGLYVGIGPNIVESALSSGAVQLSGLCVNQ